MKTKTYEETSLIRINIGDMLFYGKDIVIVEDFEVTPNSSHMVSKELVLLIHAKFAENLTHKIVATADSFCAIPKVSYQEKLY